MRQWQGKLEVERRDKRNKRTGVETSSETRGSHKPVGVAAVIGSDCNFYGGILFRKGVWQRLRDNPSQN